MEILAINKQMREWFPHVDISHKSICHKTFNDPPSEKICPYCPVRKTLRDGKVYESVTETPAGKEIRNYRIVSSPVKDKEGNITAVIEMVEDITEYRKTQEKLELFRFLIDKSNDSIFLVDLETGNFLDVNEKACSSLSYEREELLKMAVKDIEVIIPDDFSWKTHMEEVKERKFMILEGIHKGKDGKTFPVEVSISYTTLKDRDYMISVARDITERKKVQEELELFRYILDRARDKILLTDPESGKFLDVNQHACISLGYKREELLNMKVMDIELEIPDETVWKKCAMKVKEEKFILVYGRTKRKDGTVFPVEIIASYVTMKDRDYIVSVVRDITERKKAEEELKKYSDHLVEMVEEKTKELVEAREKLLRKEKLVMLGQMAGTVGHELKNPLATMNNAVYFLKMILPGENDLIKEYLEILSVEIRRIDKIVTNLRNFSRVKSVAEKEKIDVAFLLEQVIERAEPHEGVAVRINIPSPLPSVYFDKGHLEQIFLNLFNNAFQAMKDGGILSIDVRGEEDFISVATGDTGCGISRENLEKIFEPLFTTKPKGIGLGLYICRNLTEANGGKIMVESEEGKGTTFILEIPVVRE